jgi:hypothetical protein
MLELFIEFLVAMLENGRPEFRFFQVQEHAHDLGYPGFWCVRACAAAMKPVNKGWGKCGLLRNSG